MSVKFKLSANASEASVLSVLDELRQRGLAAERLFPEQQRPSLARMFIIRSPEAKPDAVAAALERFGSDVEYVESDVKRKPR
jgi:hypothetical protein